MSKFSDSTLYIKTATRMKVDAKRRLAVQWRKHHKNPKSLVKNLADLLENDALTQLDAGAYWIEMRGLDSATRAPVVFELDPSDFIFTFEPYADLKDLEA